MVASVENNSEEESHHTGFDEYINNPATSAYLTQCASDTSRVTLNCPLNLESLSGLTMTPVACTIILCVY